MIFSTDRLYVRKLNLDDFEAFNEMQSNKNVMKYIIGRPKTKEESKKELDHIISMYEKSSGDFCVMAVINKDNHKFIGTCAVIKNGDFEYEIGYRFIEKIWGNGYGKELLHKLIKYCLVDRDLKEIVAYVDKENIPSVKILDKSSMEFAREYNNEEGKPERMYKGKQ